MAGNQEITLAASTADGCFAYDTVDLKALQPKSIFLGNDTAFCSPGFLVLSAGMGYAQYLWSNGQKSSDITVNSSGTYWVNALDTNGCTAKDTLSVQVYNAPVPDLGDDGDLCSGQQRTLDAGNYSGYLWQDGSVQRYNTAKSAGVYWVTVSDNHNCSASDTLHITNVFPAPSNFLDSYDSICQYEKIQVLARGNYSNYLWSTGSMQNQIITDVPGMYVLSVTDSNGCSGSDTINIIQKNCYFGVYIPNAFTPNGDHLNDVFRAKVYGTPLSFNLVVYNIFGQVVYNSNDPLKGWDGTTKGNPTDAGVFVWQCSYQLEGGKPVFEKGTVTLIR